MCPPHRGEEPVGPGGLAPSEARPWLELQQVLAWQPEQAGEALRAGLAPAAVLARARRAGSSAPLDPRSTLARSVARLERVGARVLPMTHPDYPPRLALLRDAPPVLLARGEVGALQAPGIAIVGARAATRLARRTTRRLARELAESGFTIVSGLARGIDAEAHLGALEATGRTVAVLACGPERVYPPEHRRLAGEILERGTVVSEMPVGSPPRRSHFPLRNRLISGLAIALVVVEARRRSGSLITVRHALDQGREVFVVPGAVDGPFAEGSNQLLREGARPIRDAADLLEDLGIQPVDPMRTDRVAANPSSSSAPPGAARIPSAGGRVLDLLAEGPLEPDALVHRSGLAPGPLARVLIELELAGRVRRERDGRIHRVWP